MTFTPVSAHGLPDAYYFAVVCGYGNRWFPIEAPFAMSAAELAEMLQQYEIDVTETRIMWVENGTIRDVTSQAIVDAAKAWIAAAEPDDFSYNPPDWIAAHEDAEALFLEARREVEDATRDEDAHRSALRAGLR